MCSTHNPRSILLFCATLAAAASGCQPNVPNGTARLNNSPLIIDDAMQKREWDRSICYYGNGNTIAGGTGYMYQTHETIPDDWRRISDVPVATMNIALLPVGIFVNTPFKAQVCQGEVIPPTYTGQPPLP